jgi:hypothetical protein
MAARRGHWKKVRGTWRWVGKLPWRTQAASAPAGDIKTLSRWMRETSEWGEQAAVKMKEMDDRLDTIEKALKTITRQLGRHG